MNAIKAHPPRLGPPVFILSAAVALMGLGAPAPTWETASGLFANGRWAEAEKALDAYAAQTPSPPHRAAALVLEASCREKRRDDIQSVPHSNDDGLHFCSEGYGSLANTLLFSIFEGLY